MENRTKIILAITGTAVVSGIIGFFIAKKKYDADLDVKVFIPNEEPASDEVIDEFMKQVQHPHIPEKPDLEEYARRVNDYVTITKNRTVSPLDISIINEPIEEEEDLSPHIISPEEFAKIDDYDDVTYTYYSDDVLADENDRRMSEIEIISALGKGTLDQLGDEDDTLYVRNPRLKMDYEILCDMRTYEEVLNERPYIRDEERHREELEDE